MKTGVIANSIFLFIFSKYQPNNERATNSNGGRLMEHQMDLLKTHTQGMQKLKRVVQRIKSNLTQSLAVTICTLGLLMLEPSAHAATLFFDDFEDMNLDGWTQSNSGGTATFEVVERNGSNRAHVRHVSNTSTGDQSSLSSTFDYTATDVVSFEMEALAFLGQFGGRIRHGLAGVEVSFLNNFNVPLGSAGLFNVTSESLLGPNDFPILSTQQSYSATMAEFAELAGLDDADPIAKMSLSFLARGSFSFGGNIQPNVRSGGDVWFDNVGVVPLPAAVYLFGSGLLGLIAVARRKKAA